MLYLSWGKGRKPAGINAISSGGAATTIDEERFDSEKMENWEFGWKTAWELGGALQLNGALLAGAGLTWKDVKVTPVPNIINGAQLLVENRIDAIYFAVGPAKLREIDATISILCHYSRALTLRFP